MKKLLIIAGLISISGLVHATTLTAPSQLIGTSVIHGEDAYSWGISIAVPTGQQIASASVTFSNIKLTASGNSAGTGYLYSDLLNLNKPGYTAYTDNDASGDYFSGKYSSSSFLTQFFSSVGTTLNWTYTLTSTQIGLLNTYLAATGNFAIGLDPDCTYNVGDITFTYTTGTGPNPHGSVPDAGTTALLLGTSLLGLELFRRSFARAVKV